MNRHKFGLTLWIALTFCGVVQAAALRERAQPNSKQVPRLAVLLKHIQSETPLCPNTTQLCIEYADAFPFVVHKPILLTGKASITCAADFGTRHLLANNASTNHLTLIDKTTGKRANIKSPHQKPITGILYLSRFRVVTRCQNWKLCAWDMKTGQIIQNFGNWHQAELLAKINKKKFISAEEDDVCFWDCSSRNFTQHRMLGSNVHCLLCLNEGLLVAAGLHNGTIRLLGSNYAELSYEETSINASQFPIVSLAGASWRELFSLDSQSNVYGWDLSQGPPYNPLYTINQSSMNRLITCGDQIFGTPELLGPNWLLELHDRTLEPCGSLPDKESRVDTACSSNNSFTLILREVDGKKSTRICTFTHHDKSLEEKHNDDDACATQLMQSSKKKSQCMIQ